MGLKIFGKPDGYFFAGNYERGSAADDEANQSADLLSACKALIAYRDAAGPLNFQLEKADDFINTIRAAIAKAEAADDTA